MLRLRPDEQIEDIHMSVINYTELGGFLFVRILCCVYIRSSANVSRYKHVYCVPQPVCIELICRLYDFVEEETFHNDVWCKLRFHLENVTIQPKYSKQIQ